MFLFHGDWYVVALATEFYSLHINCGGKEASIEGNIYEDDTDPAGPSRFYQSRTNWRVSTTGHFMDDARSSDSYTWTNATKLSANTSALYMDARLSPISLTYYGFCMGSGSYTVTLHFPEIMFTDDKTHSMLALAVHWFSWEFIGESLVIDLFHSCISPVCGRNP